MNQHEMAEVAVDRIERGFGAYPGYRRAHARGDMYEALFTANGEAAQWTTAPHFKNGQTRAIVRFSHSSPDPLWPDAQSPVKGMAVRFENPDGSAASVVGVNAPIFFARTPETFNEMVGIFKSFKEGKPRLRDLITLFIKYPDSRAAIRVLRKLHAPESFATGRYYSMHAYYFIGPSSRKQPVKYEWEPEAGVHTVDKPGDAGLGWGIFEKELRERVARGPVGFRLFVRIGEEGDPTDDPTKPWPEERRRVEIGRLVLGRVLKDAEGMKFDPTEVTEGIQCTEDPILHYRHHAYSVSHKRRSEGR